MRKGEKNVTVEESEEILAMALAIQEYEQEFYGISFTETFEE